MKRRIRSIDILSGLPDEVLCHILSFLPTKLSVCTSVLAKRWRFLWSHVPNLRFYEHDFRDDSETQPLDIISRVAMLHQAEILNTFKLSKVKGCTSYQLDTLIIYLTKRNLRNLHLDFVFNYEDAIVCTLPRLLFICKTLVDLRLVNCGLIPSSGELFLPSLKKLNLSCVEYADDESLPHLLSGCPVLEELIVKVCFREEPKDSNCVTVSSPTIKKLIVDFSLLDDDWNVDMLIIDVPALVYLKVDSCFINRVKSLSKTMTSLIEAEISLNRDEHDCSTDCTKLGPWDEFLSCLCQVRYLKISSSWDMAVHLVGTGSMTKFVNITKLELEDAMTVNWYNLVKFLEVADNLEVLIVFISTVKTPPYIEPKRVPPCMLSRLRTVTLSYFDACEEDYFGMVRYILRNAQVLERMEILSCSTKKKVFDALRRILLFERGSTSCQVAFNTF